MIIMIIFLILSVLFIIGTYIYVKRKDKRNIIALNNKTTKKKKKISYIKIKKKKKRKKTQKKIRKNYQIYYK